MADHSYHDKEGIYHTELTLVTITEKIASFRPNLGFHNKECKYHQGLILVSTTKKANIIEGYSRFP